MGPLEERSDAVGLKSSARSKDCNYKDEQKISQQSH